MIKLTNVVKKYGSKVAVDGISFEINEGEVCVLLGPSGCGKSTTLKMINRILEPSSGDIFVNGENIKDLKPELLRRKMGYVIQSVGLFPHMTVGENIAVVPKLLNWEREEINQRIVELLNLVGLESEQYQNKYPNQLSGGEAQRIGVARALAANPPVLLADEPFGAVDPLTREKLQVEFTRIQRKLKKTVIFVTHDLDEAIRLADSIVLMKSGKIIQYDTPENLLANPIDKFVRDFVGADRALKRLSRFPVSKIMKKPENVLVYDQEKRRILNKTANLAKFFWITKEDSSLIGWIDGRKIEDQLEIEDVLIRINLQELPIREDASIKDALSRMLEEGIKTVPVINELGQLIGEINLADIERITEGGES